MCCVSIILCVLADCHLIVDASNIGLEKLTQGDMDCIRPSKDEAKSQHVLDIQHANGS
jgi:hypothetical protein